jgi:hypothetical protein
LIIKKEMEYLIYIIYHLHEMELHLQILLLYDMNYYF